MLGASFLATCCRLPQMVKSTLATPRLVTSSASPVLPLPRCWASNRCAAALASLQRRSSRHPSFSVPGWPTVVPLPQAVAPLLRSCLLTLDTLLTPPLLVTLFSCWLAASYRLGARVSPCPESSVAQVRTVKFLFLCFASPLIDLAYQLGMWGGQLGVDMGPHLGLVGIDKGPKLASSLQQFFLNSYPLFSWSTVQHPWIRQ